MRRESKKAKQPPFVLLNHNVQSDVAQQLAGLARFRQVGEAEGERRFRRDAKDHEIFMGPRRFLFVSHDRDFLDHHKLPNSHGGIVILLCPENKASEALGSFLNWWGPKRNLLRNRVFALSEAGGYEALRNGDNVRIYREPS